MSYLPTWLRASLRTTTNKWLKDTAKIEALSLTVGDIGQPVELWTTVVASVACRVLMNRNSNTANIAGQEMMTDEYPIVFPAGTALAVQQRVTVNSTDVYNVSGIRSDMTDELFTAVTGVRQR